MRWQAATAPFLLALACEPTSTPEPTPPPQPVVVPVPPTAQEVLAERKQACDGGDTEVCLDLGNAADVDEAIWALERACDQGSATGCRALASRSWEHKRVDLPGYMQLVTKACALSHPKSCSELAKGAIEGWTGPPDFEQAKLHAALGCELGSKLGCTVSTVVDAYEAIERPGKPLKNQYGSAAVGGIVALDLECKRDETHVESTCAASEENECGPPAFHLESLVPIKKTLDACGDHWSLVPVTWKVRRNKITQAVAKGETGKCIAETLRTIERASELGEESPAKRNWDCRATLLLGY